MQYTECTIFANLANEQRFIIIEKGLFMYQYNNRTLGEELQKLLEKDKIRKNPQLAHNSMSDRASVEIVNGSHLYAFFTKQYILEEIERILNENPEQNMPFSLKRLEGVSEVTLKKMYLRKSSWHHVNFKPTWFYKISYELIFNRTWEEVLEEELFWNYFHTFHNKPTLVKLQYYHWITKADKTQMSMKRVVTGVAYKGLIYTSFGEVFDPIKSDVIIYEIKKTLNKPEKKLFQTILTTMRKQGVKF